MKAINKYMSASNSVKNGAGELYICGTIEDSKWWDDEVSPKSVRDALNDLDGASVLEIHINSYGGSCVAGNAIISILDGYRKKNNATLDVYIEGIAASMGSGIASVGDHIYMADNALYMIHKPSSVAAGNADDLQKTIDVLNKTEDTLVANYMRRFNGTEDELRQIMADETWFTADEAKEHGFVDEIIEGQNISACAKGIKIGDQVFGTKVSDLVKNKLPGVKIQKEVKTLDYDEQLKDFGITEDAFKNFKVDSAVLLDIAGMVASSIRHDPVEQFVDKASALEQLGCEDITADQLIDYAKAGMNPVDTTDLQNKATAYDKIMKVAIDNAVQEAVRAEGKDFDEALTRKMLAPLTYDELQGIASKYREQAKSALHAGTRNSLVIPGVKEDGSGSFTGINYRDIIE